MFPSQFGSNSLKHVHLRMTAEDRFSFAGNLIIPVDLEKTCGDDQAGNRRSLLVPASAVFVRSGNNPNGNTLGLANQFFTHMTMKHFLKA